MAEEELNRELSDCAQHEDRIEGVRNFFAAFSKALERDGIFLNTVRFIRDEQTGELQSVVMKYIEKEAEE